MPSVNWELRETIMSNTHAESNLNVLYLLKIIEIQITIIF